MQMQIRVYSRQWNWGIPPICERFPPYFKEGDIFILTKNRKYKTNLTKMLPIL